MLKHWRYLKYVLRHKWYVFLYGWQLGIPWLALLHDNSKFRPSEWFPYAEFFYSGPHRPYRETSVYEKTYYWDQAWRTSKEGVKEAFDYAWLHHQKRNKHHWQFWLEVSPSLHNCYTASRWGNGDRLRWLRNFVAGVASFVRAKISSTPNTSARSAASTGWSTSSSIGTNTGSEPTLGTDPITGAIQTSSVLRPSATRTGSEGELSSTTVASAPAAAKPPSSSWPSTILPGTGKSTASEMGSSAEHQPIGGSSETGSHRTSDVSAITATQPLGSTATVRMAELSLLRYDDGGVRCLTCNQQVELTDPPKVLPMPDRYRREMLADWKGAGRAINGVEDALGWYRKNRDKMTLHPETRQWVEDQLGYIRESVSINVEAFMRP